MMNFETGGLVISRAGHDKDNVYMIIGQEDDFLYLADGRLRPLDRPKKKRKKHVQLMRAAVPEESRSDDAALRHFLKSYGGNGCQNLM